MARASAGLSSAHSPPPDPLMTVTTFTKRHDLRPFPDVTAFSSPKLVESAQSAIDVEINKYSESIRTLKSRRNALSQIGRLPPEILSRVFLFCIDPDSLRWIKEVSHISRHWRAVALGCPALWTSPIFLQPKWADEMLKRSKSAALTIKGDLTNMTPRMLNTVHSSLGQISRIKELDVTTGSRSLPEILNLTDTAPHLHSLSLASPGYYNEEHFTIPDTFLNGDAPRLRRLELTRFFLPWSSPLLNNLLHLKIQNPGPAARPSITELVDALGRMPMLETLELDNALPIVDSDAASIPHPEVRTSLAYLKRIIVGNTTVLECANVFNHLAYPSSTSVKISCKGKTCEVAEFSPILPILANLRNDNPKHLRALKVKMVYHGLSLQAWTCFNKLGDRDLPRARAFLDLDLRYPSYRPTDAEDLLHAVCKALPLHEVRGLSVSSELHELGVPTWLSCFADLPTLRSIRLDGDPTAFIHTLREDVVVGGVKQIPANRSVKPTGRRASLRSRAKSAGVAGGLFFPALRDVVLDRADFTEPVFDALQDALMERCERKQELWTLAINDAIHIDHEDVELLREIVPDVKWDGVEQGYSDDEEEEDMDMNYAYFGGLLGHFGGYAYNSDDDLF